MRRYIKPVQKRAEIIKVVSDFIANGTKDKTDNNFEFDFENRATDYERLFIKALIRAAKGTRLQFDIHWNQFLFFSYRTTKRHLIKNNKLDLLQTLNSQHEKAKSKQITNKNIYYRCPDFYIPRYNLAIEINGDFHHQNDNKIEKDKLLSESMITLGTYVWPIENSNIYNEDRRTKICREIIDHIIKVKDCAETKRKSNNARKILCTNRKKYNFTYSHRNSEQGVSSLQFNYSKLYRHPSLLNHLAYTKHCGVNICLNTTVRRKNLNKKI